VLRVQLGLKENKDRPELLVLLVPKELPASKV